MVTQVKDSIGVTAAGARYATLSQILEGEVRSDRVARGIYATDAS